MIEENPLDDLKKDARELWHEMDDNTQFNNNSKDLKFVKMCISRDHIDFILDHFRLNNLVEVNEAAIYVLKTLAHMDEDGWNFAIFKWNKDKTKTEETSRLDLHGMVKQIVDSIRKQNG